MTFKRVFLRDETVVVDKVLMSPRPSDGTENFCYYVYEKMSDVFPWSHSTVTHIDEKGQHYGKLATRGLSKELAALMPGAVRVKRVRAHYEGLYEESYKLIVEAFPEAANGVRRMGSIDCYNVKPEVRS